MWLKLMGYIDTEDEVDNYLSLEIPIFSEEEGCKGHFIQIIDEISYSIKGFQDVTSISFVEYKSDILVREGNPALYVFKYNDKIFVGTKSEADRYVSTKINTLSLFNFNLYSLYTFLGLRKKVIEVVDLIIKEENYELDQSDFVIPDEETVPEGEVVLEETAVSTYANVFFSLTKLNYADLLDAFIYGKNSNILAIRLGLYRVTKNFIVKRLELFTTTLPQTDAEFRLNDFIMGLLIVMRESLPDKAKFWNYISNEIIKSEQYNDSKVISNIKDVHVRSSTNFYQLKPEEKIGDESFVFTSIMVEKGIKDWDNPPVLEITSAEEEQNSLIKGHIIDASFKLARRE